MNQDSGGAGSSAPNTGSPNNDCASKRLLIIEGDGFTRLLLLRWFRTVGFRVDFTANGELGFRKMRMREPDALVMDVKLRGISGPELIKKARALPSFGNKPIYAFARPDKISRSTKKFLSATEVKIFNRDVMSVEKFVAHVLSELVPLPEVVQEVAVSAAPVAQPESPLPETVTLSKAPVPPAPNTVPEVPAPKWPPEPRAAGALLSALGAASEQAEMLLRCTEQRTRLASCGVLRAKLDTCIRAAVAAGREDAIRFVRTLERWLTQLFMRPEYLETPVLETLRESVPVLRSLAVKSMGPATAPPERSVVVVNESRAAGEALAQALQGAGCTPVLFTEPAAARKHLEGSSTSLVISALDIPEAHGLDEKAIHEFPANQHTPVLQFPRLLPDAVSSADAATTPTPAETNPVQIMETTIKALNALYGPPAGAGSTSAGHAGAESASAANALPAPSPASTRPPGAEPTVLFVEDDPFIVKVYKKRLKTHGYRVETAEDGAVAIERLPELKPDAVVLDLMLPRVSGLEVLQFIRADANLKSIPVVVLSNVFLDALATKAMQAGATQGILKTQCTPGKLLVIMQQLLGTTATGAAPQALPDSEVSFTGDNGETAVWIRQNDPVIKAPMEVAKIREACLEFIKSGGSAEGTEELENLYRRVRFLSARAGLRGLTKVCEIASALEALLFDLTFHFSEPTPSVFQTIAQAVDCLARLIQNGDTKFPEPRLKPKVLVVDDDAVCTFTTVAALKRANFDATGVQSAEEALTALASCPFDLVILDINMPGKNGFEVCEELRKMPQNEKCPVLFFTLSGEFQTRARSVLAGGNDLLTKPATAMELVLKASLHIVNSFEHHVKERTKARPSTPESLSAIAVWKAEQIQPDVAPGAEAPAGKEATAEQPQDAIGSNGDVEAESQAPDALSPDMQPAAPESTPADTLHSDRSTAPADLPQDLSSNRVNLTPEETPSRIAESTAETVSARAPLGDLAEVAEAACVVDQQQAEVSALSSPVAVPETQESAAAVSASTAEAVQEKALSVKVPGDELTALRERSAKQQQTIEKLEKERESIVDRVYQAETNLYREQARVKRREKTIENLQEKGQQLEAELAKAREDASKYPELERTANASTAQIKELETRLAKYTTEWEGLKTSLQQQLDTQAQLAADLRRQLANQQQAGSAGRVQELEQELKAARIELEQARTSLEAQARSHTDVEVGLRQQLEVANAAHKGAQQRSAELDHEVAELKQAREELQTNLADEQKAAAASSSRFAELEQQFKQATADLQQARASLEAQAKRPSEQEADLRQQLQAATAVRKEEEQRWAGLEQQVAELKQARAELQTSLDKEQQAAAASAGYVQQLQQELKRATTELQEARTSLEAQAKARAEIETDLRRQLQAASDTQTQQQRRCAELENETGMLRRTREELETALEEEWKKATGAAGRFQELGRQLERTTAELQQTHATFELQVKGSSELQADLRKQVEAANAACRDERKHSAALERELSELKQAREELQAKVGTEQAAAAKSAARVQELEQQLNRATAEVKQAHASLEAEAKDRTQVELELHRQLQGAKAIQKREQKRCADTARELAELKQAREELFAKVGHEKEAAAASARRSQDLEQELKGLAAELQQARAGLEAQAKDRAKLESDLRAQLEAATGAQQEQQQRCAGLERQLAELTEAREKLRIDLVNEQNAAAASARRSEELEQQLKQAADKLQQAQTSLETQAKDRAELEANLRRQLQAATVAQANEQQRCAALEAQAVEFKQAHEALQASFANEHKAAEAAGTRIQQLQQELQQAATRVQQARTALEAEAKSRAELQDDLRLQIQAVTSAHSLEQQRCSELERSVADLRKERDQLEARVNHESHAAAELATCKQLLEDRLQQSQTTLALQAQERGRIEAELQQKLGCLGAAHKQAEEHSAQLERELAALRQAHEQLQTDDGKQRQATADAEERVKGLESLLVEAKAKNQQLHEESQQREIAALARVTAELAQERGAKQRAEKRAQDLGVRLLEVREELSRVLEAEHANQAKITELNLRLQQVQENADRVALNLAHEIAERQQAQEQLGNAKELNAQYRENLATLTQGKEQFQKTQADLESRLQHLTLSLTETQTKLQSESGERGRLAAALDATGRRAAVAYSRVQELEVQLKDAQAALGGWESKFEQAAAEREELKQALLAARNHAEAHGESMRVETSRLDAALQLERAERKRLEAQLLHLRQSAIESAHGSRAERIKLRKQFQTPVLRLFETIRQTLTGELSEEQKRVCESMLNDVLLLQNTLQEPGANTAEAAMETSAGKNGEPSGL